MLRLIYIIFTFLTFPYFLPGQFAPAADQANTTAIHKDSSIFINWAKKAEIYRGQQNISDDSIKVAEIGEDEFALGIPDNQTVSLGDGGFAILTFNPPIQNGEGFDFAVFENGFATQGGYFLELAFVEVSSDGQFFVRFPAISLTDTTEQLNTFDLINPEKINNLAGKYVGSYGTPFDLKELDKIPGLDIEKISHIKVIDIVGSLADSLATFDGIGNKINDPFPTPFPSGGFDLDAVGVIHEKNATSVENIFTENLINVFPNPLLQNDVLFIENLNTSLLKNTFQLFSNKGQLLKNGLFSTKVKAISFSGFSKGVYWLKINNNDQTIIKKIMVQ